MTDLRDEIHGKALTADEKVFLDYHRNSPWAVAKVKAGVGLFPESVAYMQRELDERARAEAERKKILEKDDTDETQQPPKAATAGPAEQRDTGADGMGGSPGNKPQDS